MLQWVKDSNLNLVTVDFSLNSPGICIWTSDKESEIEDIIYDSNIHQVKVIYNNEQDKKEIILNLQSDKEALCTQLYLKLIFHTVYF